MASIRKLHAGHTHADGVQVGGTGEKIGFLGATPVVQVASASQAAAAGGATVDAECRTLANALRSALVTLGLIKGSA